MVAWEFWSRLSQAVAGADRNDKRMVVLWHIAEDAVRGFQLLPIGH